MKHVTWTQAVERLSRRLPQEHRGTLAAPNPAGIVALYAAMAECRRVMEQCPPHKQQCLHHSNWEGEVYRGWAAREKDLGVAVHVADGHDCAKFSLARRVLTHSEKLLLPDGTVWSES
jgi:hypothetical protein